MFRTGLSYKHITYKQLLNVVHSYLRLCAVSVFASISMVAPKKSINVTISIYRQQPIKQSSPDSDVRQHNKANLHTPGSTSDQIWLDHIQPGINRLQWLSQTGVEISLSSAYICGQTMRLIKWI